MTKKVKTCFWPFGCKTNQVGTLGWKRLKLFLLVGDKTKQIGYVLEFELFLLARDKTNEIDYRCNG